MNRKIIVAGCTALLAGGVAISAFPRVLDGALAIAQVPHPSVGLAVQPAREISVASLKVLLSAAKGTGGSVAYIGSPTWALDGTMKSKPGAYLLDDGHVVTVAAQ